MRGHRLARPDRADFAGGVIADGEDEIHDRRARLREFVPAFAVWFLDGNARALQYVQGIGIDFAGGKAAGAEAAEFAATPVIQQGFGDDAAC
jgi:hypothetical protein